MSQALWTALALAAGSAARFVADSSAQIPLTHASSCENTAVSRQCWGQYNLSTNYYTRFPDTGRTVEVWLSVEEHDCSPDGYERSSCMTVNGTIPGPAIIADWGDDLVIHITNNMKTNGTSIHWHGVRQLHSVEYDGVPGVTQCPIPPGQSMTYKFKVTQYGSSWYHSHFSVQYSEGLFGPLIFNGPATANFDEDLGMLFLQDWSHQPIFNAWVDKEKYQITHPLSTILINGTNSFDCSTLENPAHAAKCSGNGTKFETVFESGKKYRIRLINTATDSQFQFSIDNHMLKVIAIDFVPIEPYDTESIIINSAQRYDIVVEANAQPGDYWLRADWVAACFGVANENPENSRGIVRYNAASKLDPVSESTVAAPKTCGDEPYDKLVPYLKFNVSNITTTTVEDLEYHITNAAVYHWTINSSTFEIDWSQPTLLGILDNVSDFPSTYNIVDIDSLSTDAEWAVLVIQNLPGSFFVNIAHPLHLHGHDFWILAQESRKYWDGNPDSFNTINPPRRDVAMLPSGGYLAIAFKLDNPGVWLVHCHIAWHASQGLALEFVESKGSVIMSSKERAVLESGCSAWEKWSADAPWKQGDSGI